MFIEIIRFSAFILSLYGGSRLISDQLKIDRVYSWLAFILSVIITLYVVAFFGWLERTVYLIFGLSILYGLYCIGHRAFHQNYQRSHWVYINVWMILYCSFIGIILWSSRFVHYDNFSHWALIVKYLFTEDTLPTASDTIIRFSSYPMGTTLFLYYAVKIVGFSEKVMLLAQFALISSALYTMFAVIRDRTRVMIVSLMITGIMTFNIFNITIRMNNLLVDFVLPVLALAGISSVFTYRKQPLKMSFLVFLITAVLTLVKSSGVIISLIVWIYYLYQMGRVHPEITKKLKRIGSGFVTICLSAIPILYWNIYVKANFPVTKHEVSIFAYQSIFEAKDNAVIQDILTKMGSYFFDFSQISTFGFLLFNLLLLISYLIIRFGIKRRNTLLKFLILGDLIYFVYYGGITLMFLFSMPVDEAIALAGIERYSSSMIIFILGIALFALVREIDYSFFEQDLESRNHNSYKSLASKQLYQISTIILSFASLLLLISEVNGMRYLNSKYDKSIPGQFTQASGHNFELNNDRYLVVTTDSESIESFYTGFVGYYFLYSAEVVPQEEFTMNTEKFGYYMEGFDKVVILVDNIEFNSMMKQLVGNHYNVGIYAISDITR